MAGASLASWLWWAGSVGVGALLLAVGLWALYGGRPRGRVCPRCHYNMTQINGLRCPECGYEARRLGQLRARPRHPRFAILCFLLLNIGVGLAVARLFYPSWQAMMPDHGLVLLLPIAGGAEGPIWQEAKLRIITGELSDSAQRSLVSRCVRGDYGARPLSPQWRERYGALLRTWTASKPGLEFEELLYEVPVQLELLTREHWPENTELCVQARVEDWWPLQTEIKLTAQADVEGAKSETFIRTGQYQPASRFAMFLPPMDEGAHEITYTFAIARRQPKVSEHWEDVSVEEHTVKLHVKGKMDHVLPPAMDVELDRRMADLFSIGIGRWESGISPVRVYFEPERTFIPEFEGMAIGVSVRVLFKGRVARSMNLWWLAGPQKVSPHEWNLGWEVPWEDLETLTTAPGDEGLWSVQVVALQEVALRVVGAKRYWEGAVTVPTTVIEREGEAPAVPWMRVDQE